MPTRKFRVVSAQESGIGGFLLLFVIIQVVTIGFVAWYVPGTIAAFRAPEAASEPEYLPIMSVLLFLQIARGVAYIVGLVLIFRRDPRTRTFYLWVLPAALMTYLLQGLGKPIMEHARVIVYTVVWFLYWRTSERVRLTFAPKSGMTEIPKTL